MSILKTITFPGDTEPRVIVDGAAQNMIGDLAGLKTENKDNIVNAINEICDSETSVSQNIVGDLVNLKTENKDNIVNAINEVYDSEASASNKISTVETNVSTNSTNITNLQTQLNNATEQFTTALDNKITSPSTGVTDQILAIAAIDDSGKPISWKAIDMVDVVEVDTTLSIPGAAADSATIGTAINNTNIIIGDLNNLNTSNKSNLVSAINEMLESIGSGGDETTSGIQIDYVDFSSVFPNFSSLNTEGNEAVYNIGPPETTPSINWKDYLMEEPFVIIRFILDDITYIGLGTLSVLESQQKIFCTIDIDNFSVVFTISPFIGEYTAKIIKYNTNKEEGIPPYSNLDYGKVLMCTESGPTWVTIAVSDEIPAGIEGVKF